MRPRVLATFPAAHSSLLEMLKPSHNHLAVHRRMAVTNPCMMLQENLADRPFRMALADTTGGFDEACIGWWVWPLQIVRRLSPWGYNYMMIGLAVSGTLGLHGAGVHATYCTVASMLPPPPPPPTRMPPVPCAEFMRVPRKPAQPQAAVRGVCTPYDAAELAQWDAALGAQVMGSEPEVLALAADYLARVKRAPRVDLNCGCPANSVTGNGAGSR